MKFILKFLPLFFISIALTTNLTAFASDLKGEMDDKVSQIRESAGFDAEPASIGDVLGYAIQIVLSLLAVIFLILTIIAGFKWMTASGNEETITKAKKSLKESIIGLFIVLASYAITYFIFSQLGGAGLGIGTFADPVGSG